MTCVSNYNFVLTLCNIWCLHSSQELLKGSRKIHRRISIKSNLRNQEEMFTKISVSWIANKFSGIWTCLIELLFYMIIFSILCLVLVSLFFLSILIFNSSLFYFIILFKLCCLLLKNIILLLCLCCRLLIYRQITRF